MKGEAGSRHPRKPGPPAAAHASTVGTGGETGH